MTEYVSRVGAIEPHPLGPVQVRIDRTIAMPDGEVAAPSVRYVLNPGDSLTGQPAPIAAACAAYWTTERVAAWQALVAAQEQGGAP